MRIALILVATLSVQPAFANALALSGTLDGRAIVAELTEPSDGAVVGRYSFSDTGGDIPLTAVSHEDGLWVLNEEAPCSETTCIQDDQNNITEVPIAAVWEVRFDPETYTVNGIRRSTGAKPKEMPIELGVVAWRELGPDEVVSAAALHERSGRTYYDESLVIDWPSMPYEMLVVDAPMDAGDVQELAGGAQYQYLTDPRTKFAFPRAVSLPGGEPVDGVNTILSRQHYRMNLSAFDCLAFRYAAYGANQYMVGGGNLADFDSEVVTLTFLSPRVVSWTQSGSLWCGGAHPYNHSDSYNYDVATGAPVPLQKIFSAWVPRKWGAAPDEIADAAEVAANPDSYSWGPTPEFAAYVREKIPPELLYDDEPELNEACYSDQALSEYLDIRFEAPLNAVFTVTGYPHVISVCSTDLFSVPMTDLWDFLGPDASDYFPELGG